MKKAKKLLAVLLAVIMALTTMSSVLMASAATQSVAQAEADAFNANEMDHSKLFDKMSIETAESLRSSLNGLLVPILEAVNIRETLYSDATATSLMKMFADLMSVNPSTTANNISWSYPEARNYIGSLRSWDDFDPSLVVWNITPGDREAFVNAINGGNGNINAALGFVLLVIAPDLYEPLADLLEAFHVGKMPEAAMDLYQNGSLYFLADILTKAIDALLADPLGYIGDILPDVAWTYGKVAAELEALLTMLESYNISLGFDLPADFSGVVTMVGSALGFEFPAFDVRFLATMGVASAVESGLPDGFRMAINGDKTMVFAALVKYIGKVMAIPANKVALTKLIGDQIGMGYGDEIGALVAAAQSEDLTSIAEASVALCESIAENLGIKSNNEGLGGFFAKLMTFFNSISRRLLEFLKSLGSRAIA